jgi:hypothetical protein
MNTLNTLSKSDVADPGKIRLGAGCRAIAVSQAVAAPSLTVVAPPAAVADAGKIRLGAGCRHI